MSWKATDVNGVRMWESSNGERVRDAADIPGNAPRTRHTHSHSHTDWRFLTYFWAALFAASVVIHIIR